jgi:hypothetical protein
VLSIHPQSSTGDRFVIHEQLEHVDASRWKPDILNSMRDVDDREPVRKVDRA